MISVGLWFLISNDEHYLVIFNLCVSVLDIKHKKAMVILPQVTNLEMNPNQKKKNLELNQMKQNLLKNKEIKC